MRPNGRLPKLQKALPSCSLIWWFTLGMCIIGKARVPRAMRVAVMPLGGMGGMPGVMISSTCGPFAGQCTLAFVRGNHESCFRAGQGWFRFIDALPWTAERNCNDPAHDMQGDFSAPYAAAISERAQFIVFDSSKSSGKPYKPADPVFAKYQEQLKAAAQLAALKPESFSSITTPYWLRPQVKTRKIQSRWQWWFAIRVRVGRARSAVSGRCERGHARPCAFV